MCTGRSLADVIAYIKEQPNKSAAKRRELAAVQRFRLHEAEAEAAHALKQQLEMVRLYEHHYQSVQRQHLAAESLLADMPHDMLYMLYDFKQHISLPLAPQEGGKWWYAKARTQV
jgi:hypothetical protein